MHVYIFLFIIRNLQLKSSIVILISEIQFGIFALYITILPGSMEKFAKITKSNDKPGENQLVSRRYGR